MKLNPKKYLTCALLMFSVLVSGAGTFSDNFNSNHDYLSGGVVGTSWSGITAGKVDPGAVTAWNANMSTNGTLTITNAGGSWVDGSDGPYLWTTIKGDGDFTNIVHVSGLAQINYNFGGLLVRDPASLTNWFYLSVFAEYGVELDWRDTVNGVSQEGTSTGPSYVELDSSTWRSWLMIARNGGIISAYASADGVNWDFLYQSARTDLTNDLQVGVYNSTYSANTCSVQFQNFSVSGPSVNTNIYGNQATGLTVTPQVNSLNVAWTPAVGSAGSLVVVRRANPLTRQPLDGITYTGNSTFGLGSNLGESNCVAYVGAGNSFTLTNVTPTIPYTVAVYAYTGSGVSTLYTLTNTPVATAAPYGNPTGIAVSFTGTNAVAVDDTIQAAVTLFFDGGGEIDITSSSTFSSANTNIASIVVSGLATGLSNGVVGITANYSTFSATSNLTVVKVPVTDDFSASWDYLQNGVAGTYWSGIMLGTNDVPFGGTPTGPTVTLLANANISNPGRLKVSTHDGGFAGGADSGFFLYRVASGDFSIAIQIPKFDSDNGTNAFHMPGLMVRAPFELAYTETFMQWTAFNEYGIGNFSRRNLGGVYAETYFQPSPAQPFIMIQRQTNTFSFYQKAHALDNWTLVGSEDHPEYDGVAMQIGIVDQTFTGNTASSEFDNLILTVSGGLTNANAPSAASSLLLTNSAPNQVSASWVAGGGSSGSMVIAHPNGAITRQPVDGVDYSTGANVDFTVGQNLGASNVVVYAGSGTSVNAINLPQALCYFTVYSYKTVSGTNYYQLVNPTSASINLNQPVTVGITNLSSGVYQLTWPQGTLLEATNLLGPWVTNVATSPYLITNPVGNKFFRIQVQ